MRHFQTLNSHLGYIMIAMTSVDMSGAVTVANISLSYGLAMAKADYRLDFIYFFFTISEEVYSPASRNGIDVFFP